MSFMKLPTYCHVVLMNYSEDLTIDIHRQQNTVPDVTIHRDQEDHLAGVLEHLLHQILSYQEKSEERMRIFIKEVIQNLNQNQKEDLNHN